MQRFEKRTGRQNPPAGIVFFLFFQIPLPGDPVFGRELCVLNASFRKLNDAEFSPRFCKAQ
jgi:hypothetical protein